MGDEVRAGDLLAVYGTLMPGLGGQERLGVTHLLRPVGPCVLAGTLVELGWYPGLLAEPGGRVRGELLEILDPAVIATLDRYEGYDPAAPETCEYERLMVPTLEPGVDAWVYRFRVAVPDDRVIASGDWRAHVASDAAGGTVG